MCTTMRRSTPTYPRSRIRSAGTNPHTKQISTQPTASSNTRTIDGSEVSAGSWNIGIAVNSDGNPHLSRYNVADQPDVMLADSVVPDPTDYGPRQWAYAQGRHKDLARRVRRKLSRRACQFQTSWLRSTGATEQPSRWSYPRLRARLWGGPIAAFDTAAARCYTCRLLASAFPHTKRAASRVVLRHAEVSALPTV
jgi:hypothetical protein